MSDKIDASNIKNIDELFARSQPVGSLARALANNLYGLNHQNSPAPILENRDTYGLAFFTRPQLNLSTTNIRNNRRLYDYLITKENSMLRYIRCMLDPKLHYAGITSALCDPYMAFIPILTNTIQSMSGWPDIVLPTFSSKAGVRGERWSIGDGCIDTYDEFDLDCKFRNVKDQPLGHMINVWISYIANVFEGMMVPYTDMLVDNEIDYNTRIYRIVLDEQRRYVKQIAATGASFPLNDAIGATFDFNDSVKYNDQTRDINIRFKCNGAIYRDSILIKEFNDVVGIFNTNMASGDNSVSGISGSSLEKIPVELLDAFNNRGYPYINPDTLELEWYISTSSKTYQNIMATVKS